MANSDISLVVEKPEEKAAARNRYSNSEATMEQSIMKDDDGSSRKRSPKYEEIYGHNPQESFLQKWKKIFVVSCLFAVLLDPLFLYVPMMKDDIKCLQSDRNLKIAALVLRSFTDLFYIFDIIVQVYTSDNFLGLIDEYRRRQHPILASKYGGYNDTWKKEVNYEYRRRIRPKITFWSKSLVPLAKIIWGSYSIPIDILAILPLPQIAILIIFSEMSDLRSLTAIRMVIMNLFVLLQYVPRVLRFYLSCKELKKTPKIEMEETAKWVKGVLNFFIYILSSHVLGAIWYFFAVQRMATCWHNACRKANGCNTSTFGCHDHHTDRNITFLNDLCPISPVNTTLFDFGIYITVLQSGIMESTNYFQKFSNCFWWGLRNLSSLGSNLEPSVDGLENLFAASVSIIGLLLFLYLIGNLQTYMQLDTARIEAYRHNIKVKQKMETKDKEIELWLSANGIPKRLHKDMKLKIMEKVQRELEENRDAGLDKIFSILPLDLRSQITDYKHRHEMKWREAESWLSANGIPKRLHKDMKLEIMDKVRQELEEDSDADMYKIFPILPLDIQSQITYYKHRHEMKGREAELCLSKKGIPKRLRKDMKLKIMEKVQEELEEDRDADVDKIFSILPLDLRSQIIEYKIRHEMKGRETELWLSKNGIPKRLHKDMKLKIMEKVQQELEENRDADMDKIFSILPKDLQSQITKYMPMTRLKQAPTLHNMKEYVLTTISGLLKPMEFDDNSIIFEEGRLFKMLFIVDGFVSIEKRDGSSSNGNLQQRTRGAGEVCGEELLSPLSILYLWGRSLLLATESAKAIGHVEALVLTAEDLKISLGSGIQKDYAVGILMSTRRTFSAKELEKATDNYHQSRIIRRDKDGTFYKGVLPMPDSDKTEVAVKKYKDMYLSKKKKYTDMFEDVDVDVAIEAAVASQTNHINVVRFLGACVEPWSPQALVFEYIPNGTLFEHIHKEAAGSFEGSSSSPTALLSLELRLKIASETAGALAYLHSLTPPIIHLLLSTKHILLDNDHTAKLSAIRQRQIVYGRSDYWTEGYMDPHFLIDGLAEKSDVYSFGVILTELLTSQKPASPNWRKEEPPLATCLLSSMEEGRLNQILDGKIIVNEATSETAKKVADLAKRCLSSERKERPPMEQVAVELEGLRKFMAEYRREEPSFSNRPTSLQP